MLASMASPRKTRWKAFQQIAENLVLTEAPKIIRQMQESPTVQRGFQEGIQRGIKLGLTVLAGKASASLCRDHAGPAGHQRKFSHCPPGPQSGVRP